MPLTGLQLASGVIVGGDAAPALTRASPAITPERALLEAVRPALEDGQCFVSFSGGMDSSIVLAAATAAARTQQLPEPVPITWRTAGDARSDESEWQDAVVAELGLSDWVRLETGADLDWVGPVAARVYARHGALFPANVHLHDPLFARATGSTLMTGIGGDQLFGLWRWSAAADVLARRSPATPRRLASVALSRLPAGARAAAERARAGDLGFDWLTDEARRTVVRSVLNARAAEPSTWPERVRWQAGRANMRSGRDALGLLAADHGAVALHPFYSPSVVEAVASAGGRHGYSTRLAALTALFPTLLPTCLRARRTKATFNDVFTREHSREAIASWDGHGLDASLVDVNVLRQRWAARDVGVRTALLLQQVSLQGTSAP